MSLMRARALAHHGWDAPWSAWSIYVLSFLSSSIGAVSRSFPILHRDCIVTVYTVSICESYMTQSNECEGIRVYSMRSTQRDDPTTSQTGK
jgi:hypothetical protein